jgi:hypothetical protein
MTGLVTSTLFTKGQGYMVPKINFLEALLALQRTNTEISKQIFPEKKIAQPHSQFPHSCVCERYILTIDLPILLQEICGLILGI